MKYLCLIYSDESGWDALPPKEEAEIYERYGALVRELKSSGQLVASAQLGPTATATTVRVRDGETLVTDGPYAETKEQLGGFFLLACSSMEDALGWAARIPSAELGAIEVRRQSPWEADGETAA